MNRFEGKVVIVTGAGSGIAGVIAFLASDDARFINGAILPIDGGVSASNGQPNFLKHLM